MNSTKVKEYTTTKIQRDSFPLIVLIKLDNLDWFCPQNPVTGLYWQSNKRNPGAISFTIGRWSKYPANMCTRTLGPQR